VKPKLTGVTTVALIVAALTTFLLIRKFGEPGIIDLVGIAYVTIKLNAISWDSYSKKREASLLDLAIYFFFFPTFAIGPITLPDQVNVARMDVTFSADQALYGLGRIIIGSALVFFVVGKILIPMEDAWFDVEALTAPETTALTVYTFCLFKFLMLYISFSGYTDIAVGFSRLFAVKVPENFNKPFLASSLPDFWRRWHMSLIAYTSKYIFFPLVRYARSQTIAVMMVFIFMGLWHALSINYVLWALAHGSIMAAIMNLPRWKPYKKTLKWVAARRWATRIKLGIGWLCTMSFVAILSTFATARSFEFGGKMILNLIGAS
jgi:alginate O-acetyltransferase complex protein AlgI